MIRRKLTSQLKAKIKADYRKLKQSDFDGDALRYLKQVRGAAKGRTHKKAKARESAKKAIEKVQGTAKKIGKEVDLIIGQHVIKPGTKAYEVIILSAKNKKQSVKKFIKENEKAIEQLLADYLLFFKSEIDTLVKVIRELPKKAEIHVPVKRKKMSRPRAIFILHSIKKAMLELAPIYEAVFIEAAYDLYGNMHFNCPQPGEYKHIEDGDELLDFIDENYQNITYIRND